MRTGNPVRSIARCAAAIVALATVALAPQPAAASSDVPIGTGDTTGIVPVRSGDLALVDADRRGVVLERGGSATKFSFDMPRATSCPGDSEHDGWRVQTFIVPAAIDTATITFGEIGPDGEHQYAVYDDFSNPVINLVTVRNNDAGQPGRIDMFPPLSFRVFPPGEIPDGTYHIGVACTKFGAMANFWETDIVITAAPDDQPAQMTWRVPSAPESAPSGASEPSSFPWTGVFIAVFVAAVLFYILASRRSRATGQLSKEPS